MNDSLTKLLKNIEPKISNIQNDRIELKSLKYVYETMTEIIELGEKSYLDILDYYDQDFIIKAIKIGNFEIEDSINKYKSSRYLLKNRNQSLQELPQYKQAVNFMDSLFKYLCKLYQDIKLDFGNKEDDIKVQELLNKYYILLQKKKILIEDIDEFLIFLNLCELDSEDKLNILIFVTSCNIKNYMMKNEIMISDEISLNVVEKILSKNQKLIESNYVFDDFYETEILTLLKNYDKDILSKKKKYVVNKIQNLYSEKKYEKIFQYYLEYDRIVTYQKEFLKQKINFNDKIFKKLIFLNKDGKSLVKKYLENCDVKYRSCIFKNLLDIEEEKEIVLPAFVYKGKQIYIKDEFVVKTIYTFLDDGYVLILGVLENEKIEEFIEKNLDVFNVFINDYDTLIFDEEERDSILGNIQVKDLLLTIDLNTLDIKNGG